MKIIGNLFKNAAYIDWAVITSLLMFFAILDMNCTHGFRPFIENRPLLTITFILFVSSPLLILPKWTNRLYTLTIIPLICLSSFIGFYMRHYYNLSLDETLFGLLFATSLAEMSDFAKMFFASVSGWLALAAIVMAVLLLLLSCKLKGHVSSGTRYLSFAFSLPYLIVILNFAVVNNLGELQHSTTFTYLRFMYKDYMKSLTKHVEAYKSPVFPGG